ncbi:MAG: zinc transporter ZntB [Oceanicaulis sp.]
MSETPDLNPVEAYRLDGRGGGEETSFEALREALQPPVDLGGEGTPGEPFAWIHVRREDENCLVILKETGLDSFVTDALLAQETRPRCTVHQDGVVLNLRGVNLLEGAEIEDMISVRFWIDRRRVVGVWLRPLYAVADVMAAIDRGAAPTSTGDLIARLALRLADRMEPVIAGEHERIDALEECLDTENIEEARTELADIRHEAIILRRFIAPQRDALSTLSIEDLSWLDEHDRARIREAADRTTRILEELEAVRERAALVHDQLMEKRAEQMNRYTLVLSVVAAIFLPLGLITGLLGINVGGIPGADEGNAFWIVCALLVAIGAVQLAIFKWIKMI